MTMNFYNEHTISQSISPTLHSREHLHSTRVFLYFAHNLRYPTDKHRLNLNVHKTSTIQATTLPSSTCYPGPFAEGGFVPTILRDRVQEITTFNTPCFPWGLN